MAESKAEQPNPMFVDVTKLQAFFTQDMRKELVFLARQSEAADRFEDMFQFMRRLFIATKCK